MANHDRVNFYISLGIGCVMVMVGVVWGAHRYQFLRQSAVAEGTLINVQHLRRGARGPGRNTVGSRTIFTIGFVPVGGATTTFTTMEDVDADAPLGAAVKVVYDRRDPQKALVFLSSPSATMWPPVFLIVAGACFFIGLSRRHPRTA